MVKVCSRILILGMFLSSGISYSVHAQDSGVDVDYKALRDYTPPPMFGSQPAPAPRVMTAPAPAADLKSSDIVEPTAADILRKIEAEISATEKRPTPVEAKAASPAEPAPADVGAVEVVQPASVSPLQSEFAWGVDDAASRAGALAQLESDFLPRLRTGDAVRLEIRSYAPGQGPKDTAARRVALLRALGLKDMIVAAGGDARRIDILPMGAQGSVPGTGRMEFVLRSP